jgi:hypothetical protein
MWIFPKARLTSDSKKTSVQKVQTNKKILKIDIPIYAHKRFNSQSLTGKADIIGTLSIGSEETDLGFWSRRNVFLVCEKPKQ